MQNHSAVLPKSWCSGLSVLWRQAPDNRRHIVGQMLDFDHRATCHHHGFKGIWAPAD